METVTWCNVQNTPRLRGLIYTVRKDGEEAVAMVTRVQCKMSAEAGGQLLTGRIMVSLTVSMTQGKCILALQTCQSALLPRRNQLTDPLTRPL